MPKVFQCPYCKKCMLTGTYGMIGHNKKCLKRNNIKYSYKSGGFLGNTERKGTPLVSNSEEGPTT